MAVVLIVVYIANLVYTLYTHQDIFEVGDEKQEAPESPLWKVVAVLIGSTILIALELELVAGSLTSTAQALGLTEFFLGIIVLAVVGNAAEYISSVYFARERTR